MSESEISEWQDAIYRACIRVAQECGADETAIDGAGSDGDEISFSMAEIEQAFDLLREKRVASRQAITLVFHDWIDQKGKSVYLTEKGVDLTGLSFHHGSAFEALVHLDSDDLDDLTAAIRDGYRPVFYAVVPTSKA